MSIIELFVINKLIHLLTTPWDKLPAFTLGIIDNNGKSLRPYAQLKTAQERVAYGTLERFAFNLRRLIEKLPGGKTLLAKYITVYALFKEENEADGLFEETFAEDLGLSTGAGIAGVDLPLGKPMSNKDLCKMIGVCESCHEPLPMSSQICSKCKGKS